MNSTPVDSEAPTASTPPPPLQREQWLLVAERDEARRFGQDPAGALLVRHARSEGGFGQAGRESFSELEATNRPAVYVGQAQTRLGIRAGDLQRVTGRRPPSEVGDFVRTHADLFTGL